MSIFSGYPSRNTQPEVVTHLYRGVGTGADELTKVYGPGLSTVRQSAGIHRLSFNEHPGTFLGFNFGFQGATPGNILGHSVTFDTWVVASGSTDGYFDFTIANDATATAHDLIATEWVNITMFFTYTGVVG